MALNLEKLERERMRFRYAYNHAPQATHWGGTFVNRFVEGSRASSYFGGPPFGLGFDHLRRAHLPVGD